jgi:lipopolysaccharide transport system permease protein
VFALLLVFLWVSGYGLNVAYLALPMVLIVQLLLCVALAFLLASLVPYLPDFKLVVEHLLHLQFFVSGLFFSAERVPEEYQFWFYLNPMASLIEDYRNILLYASWPHWGRLALIALFSVGVCAASVWLIHVRDKDYPRIIR